MEEAEQIRSEILVERVIDAPRELVWKAWTEPGYVKRWWGAKGFTEPVVRIDLREGGRYLFGMRSPEGQDFWSTGEYREIAPAERLVFTDSFSDAEGNVVPASYYGMTGDWPLELVATVTFEDADGGTKLTIREPGVPADEDRDMAVVGWNESLDKLADVLKGAAKTHLTAEPGKQDVVITSVFDAPRDAVFGIFANPDLIPRWWGPANLTTTVEEMDVRPGGTWRYVQRDADGNEYAFHGVYHDITPPERLVGTSEFEGEPGRVTLETVTFEDLGGRTRVTDRTVFSTVEDRDAALASGMREGAVESMDRFARLLEETQRGA